jgi:hypothetical protein
LVIFFDAPHFLLDNLNITHACLFPSNPKAGSSLILGKNNFICVISCTYPQRSILLYLLSSQNVLDITHVSPIIILKHGSFFFLR